MIHFNFILDDVDAENLFQLIYSNIIENHMKIQKAMIAENKDLQIAYENDIIYIKELMSKLQNTRISDDNSRISERTL
ncbi:MAG: hypothetical protein WC679_00205 [Bacteroidales bacterium]|jgi:hypothetical protein